MLNSGKMEMAIVLAFFCFTFVAAGKVVKLNNQFINLLLIKWLTLFYCQRLICKQLAICKSGLKKFCNLPDKMNAQKTSQIWLILHMIPWWVNKFYHLSLFINLLLKFIYWNPLLKTQINFFCPFTIGCLYADPSEEDMFDTYQKALDHCK